MKSLQSALRNVVVASNSRIPALIVSKKRYKREYTANSEDVQEHELYIPKPEVTRFMVDCMVAMSTPRTHAARLAENLVAADYRGHFSHGLNRLSMYVEDIKSGNCNPNAMPEILKETSGTAWVDGNNGLGVVIGEFCMNLAISKAKSESGIGWVAAKQSNHFGICQWYTEMALREGLIGMASTNTSPLVAPTRSKDKVLGTNPFSVAAPSARSSDRFLLDMSTCTVAAGKLEMQLRKGEPLPTDGWALGKDGTPTTDAEEAFYHGRGLLPLGGKEINSGYKGYGMAMFVELICGLMSGSAYGHHIRHWTRHDVPANVGQCFIAINPDCFAPGMRDRLQEQMDHIRNLEPADPAKPVLIPGDPERMAMDEVDRTGAIKYTPDHITSYRKLAAELNVQPMQEKS